MKKTKKQLFSALFFMTLFLGLCGTIDAMDKQSALFGTQEHKNKIAQTFEILYDVWEKHASNAQTLRACNVGKHGIAAGLLFKNGFDLNLWRTVASVSILTLNYLGSRWLHDKHKKNEKEYFKILDNHSTTLLKLVQGNLTWKKVVCASNKSGKETLKQELALLETLAEQAENMEAGFGHFSLVNWNQINPSRVAKQFFASETTQKVTKQLENKLKNVGSLKNMDLEGTTKSLVDQAEKSDTAHDLINFLLNKEKTSRPPVYWNMQTIISILHKQIERGNKKLNSN